MKQVKTDIIKTYEIERYSRKNGTGDHWRTITANTDYQAVHQMLKEFTAILQTERMVSNDLRLALYDQDGNAVISIDSTNLYRYGDQGVYAVPLQPAHYDQSHGTFIASAINAYGYLGYLAWDTTNANAQYLYRLVQFDDDTCDWDNPIGFEELEHI